ncbi:MAG: amidase [Paenibacillaceae bacterium]|nr:amidase [Paenibacillaceae bacterium]
MDFCVEEVTILGIQAAFKSGELTSVQLTNMYIERIAKHDKGGVALNSVLELNPDAWYIAAARDEERKRGMIRGPLHGVPILLKDNINTADNMHTSAGSAALSDSFASYDAFLVGRLREAGAVLLGKTNMTEWANFMTKGMPNGYSSRGGQVLNPYAPATLDPGGSSSGSAVAVAANLCAAAVGTETSGSILNPARKNSVVGLKPTVSLVSRAGIVPISYTQDIAGPIARTVEDAAILLGVLAGEDPSDASTGQSQGKAHPDYSIFLDRNGLCEARIGINRGYIENFDEEELGLFAKAVSVLKEAGAVIIENANVPHIANKSTVLLYEFKSAVNRYLASLGPKAPVKTLREVIEFNNLHHPEALRYGQSLLLKAEYETSGTLTEAEYLKDRLRDWRASREEGIDKALIEHRLDALFAPDFSDAPAVAGYPAIIVPAGYKADGKPFGVSFTGDAFSEPTLLRLAYAFEQATKSRVAPSL